MSKHKINTLVDTWHGQMLVNVNDTCIGDSLQLYGEWSQSEILLLEEYISKGDIVLDVGANIGTHTLFFANQVGSEGHVIAFEPQRIMFQTLCANIALNNHLNVTCLQLAAGEKRGWTELGEPDYTNIGNFGGFSLLINQRGNEIASIVTLDSLKLESCKLIKIDVEGMELQVLKGSQELIQAHQPILFVENDREYNKISVIELLEDILHYKLFWHISPLFNENNYKKNSKNVFDKQANLNMLCIPANWQGILPSLPRVDRDNFPEEFYYQPAITQEN